LAALRPTGEQPLDQLTGTALVRNVERRLAVVSDPVQVGATIVKIFCDLSLSTATGIPERIRDLLDGRRWCIRAQAVNPVEKPQRSSLPEGCRGTTLEAKLAIPQRRVRMRIICLPPRWNSYGTVSIAAT
jgi:hypothetical protein